MIFSAGSVSFTKAQLKALVAHASTDTTRPHVSSVYFNASEGAAVSTDGHRMAVCEGEGRAPWTYLVPRDAAETALRAKGAETFILNVATFDVCAFDKANRKIATIPAEQPKNGEGKPVAFPPYRQVMSTPSDRGVSQGCDARYLADVRLVAEAVPSSARTYGVVFHPGPGSLDPAIVKVGPWTVMIMPMRLGDEDKGKSAPKVETVGAIVLACGGPASPEVPSAALVLAERVTAPLAPATRGRGKRAPAIVLRPTPVNAASLGSDLAPVALLAARKSRVRQYRETFGTTAGDYRADVVQAWIDAAPSEDAAPVDRAPWG